MKMMECKKLRPLLQYAIRNYFIPSKPAELDSFSYIVIYLTNMTKYKAERWKEEEPSSYSQGKWPIQIESFYQEVRD